MFQRLLATHASKNTKLDISKLLLGHHGAKVFTLSYSKCYYSDNNKCFTNALTSREKTSWGKLLEHSSIHEIWNKNTNNQAYWPLFVGCCILAPGTKIRIDISYVISYEWPKNFQEMFLEWEICLQETFHTPIHIDLSVYMCISILHGFLITRK